MSPEPSLRPVEAQSLRFGPFDLDLRAGELWKDGHRVKLQLQPFKVLALLAGRQGQLFSRDEIQREVWPDGTFVDFEQALNFSIRQIRSALGDHAATARYIETLPRRGYRFIAPVDLVLPRVPDPPAPHSALAEPGIADFDQRPRPTPRPLRRSVLPVLAVVALVALTLLGYGAWHRGSDQAAPVFHRITFRRGSVNSARFAPDGEIVYNAFWEGEPSMFYAARQETRDSRPLPMEGARVVAVSDAGEVAFRTARSRLARAPLQGGPTKLLLDGVMAADWPRDGSDFAIVRSRDDHDQLEFPVGTVLCEVRSPSELRLSPQADRIALLEHPIPGDDRGDLVVVDRVDRKRQVLSKDWASIEGLAWSPRGDEIWFTAARMGADSALHAVRLDGRLRTITTAPGRLVLHDISRDGRVLIERNTMREEVRYRGRSGTVERDLSWFDLSRVVDISDDGRRILFGESGEGGGADYGVYLRDTDGSLPVRLGHGRPTALSPDGRLALAIPARTPDCLLLLPTGSGEVRRLEAAGFDRYEWATFLPDGRRILFTARGGSGLPRVYLREIDGPAKPKPVTPEGVGVWNDTVSPDGLQFAALEHGIPTLYPIDGGEPRPLPAAEKKWPVRWLAGDVLLLRSGTVPVHLERMALATGKLEPWRDLAPEDRAGVLAIPSIVTTTDGAAYAYSSHRRLSDLYVVDGLE